jgi:hypothetical protein
MDPRYGYEVQLHYDATVGDPNWSVAGSLTVRTRARRNSAAAWTVVDTMTLNLAVAQVGAVVDGSMCKTVRGPQIPGFVAGDLVEFSAEMVVNTGGDNGNSIGFEASNYNGNLKITEVL